MSLSLNDLRKSIGTVWEDRSGSPLVGTFIVAWCVVNWEVIYLILFVDAADLPIPFRNKLTYTFTALQNNTDWVILPIFYTILIIFAYPKLSNWVYHIQLHFKKEKFEIGGRNNEFTILTEEQRRRATERLLGETERINKLAIIVTEREGALNEQLQEAMDAQNKASQERTDLNKKFVGLTKTLSGTQDELMVYRKKAEEFEENLMESEGLTKNLEEENQLLNDRLILYERNASNSIGIKSELSNPFKLFRKILHEVPSRSFLDQFFDLHGPDLANGSELDAGSLYDNYAELLNILIENEVLYPITYVGDNHVVLTQKGLEFYQFFQGIKSK